jgi:hypothetical protein
MSDCVGCSYQPTSQPLKEHLSSPPTSTPAPLSRYLLLAHDASRRLRSSTRRVKILSLRAPLHIPLITHRLKHRTPHTHPHPLSLSAPHLLLAACRHMGGCRFIWLCIDGSSRPPRSRPHATTIDVHWYLLSAWCTLPVCKQGIVLVERDIWRMRPLLPASHDRLRVGGE